jgi:DNA primase
MVSNQTAKEEIKRSGDIVALIGQYVKLRKAGRNYMGLCPFHSEKDPSFTVNPERQTFHCFGCKKNGDIFSFWMEFHSTTFPEALRDLAERYQIPITEGYSETEEKKKAAKRNALFKINEISAAYFQKALGHPVSGKPARDYLRTRTIPDEIVSRFRLGYAPDAWDGLIKALTRHQNIDLDMAVQAGVVVRREKGGHYDRFRGRIIFPIIDQRQQVIGFGGRVLDDSLPKYLNTPETPIFHKGSSLYGLHDSFNAIRKKDRVVIVEGYMDWLALKKHGVDEVVATLGTALTDHHVRKLKGYAKEAILVFDADHAGKAAALKSLHIFANEGLSARAALLPEGHDPDSFINEAGLTRFQDLLDQARPMLDFFLDQKLSDKDSDESRVRNLKEIIPILAEIRDFTLRSLYVRRLSERIGIKEEVLLAELKTQMNSSKATAPTPIEKKERRSEKGQVTPKMDRELLSLILNYPDKIPKLMEFDCKVLFSDTRVSGLVDTIFENYLKEGRFSPEDILETWPNEGDRDLFMETLHKPYVVYSEEDAILAVEELKKKAHKIKSSESFSKARGDTAVQNQLLKEKIQQLKKNS